MEYMARGDMQSFLMKHGKIRPEEVKFISKQMLQGLECMHHNGFVHRDLKPANLLIKSCPDEGESWWIKITDFGISKMAEQSRPLPSTVCGTMGFMAPELLGFRAPGDRTRMDKLSSLERGMEFDIWAAGETIFRLLTGAPSFGDDLAHLSAYVEGDAEFPDSGLLDLGLMDASNFLRALMCPSPLSRPSATAAIEQLSWPLPSNDYVSWTTRHVYTEHFFGTTPPSLLISASGDKIVIVAGPCIYLWNVQQSRVVRSGRLYGPNHCATGRGREGVHSHASMSPDGRYVCVTHVGGSLRPLVMNTESLELVAMPDDKLASPRNPRAIKISAWSPDNSTLVTACESFLSQISVKED